ncbi:zincin, partial [Glonium stellatum]
QPLPGIQYRTSQEPEVEDQDVNACMDGLRTTYNFYRTVFDRKSVDDDGLQLEASIHYSIRFGNAFWDGTAKQMVFGDGDGNSRFGRFAGLFNPGCFVNSLDVIAHELTHAVTQFTANLEYQGQSGALNESMSDVFGAMVVQWKNDQTVDQADWLMGKDIIYQNSESLPESAKNAHSLRSIKDPEASTNLDPQPASVQSTLYFKKEESTEEDDDYGGVHMNSGVPNFAFYKVAMALGGRSWDRAGKIWYDTLTDKRLQRKAKFVDFARLTVDHAQKLYPEDKSVAQVVQKAWEEVGV